MGSFSWEEIITIVVVILIVFGPKRLPELARRAGQFMAKVREASTIVTRELQREYGDALEPVRDLQEQVRGVRKDLTQVVTSIGDRLEAPEASGTKDTTEESATEEEATAEGGNPGTPPLAVVADAEEEPVTPIGGSIDLPPPPAEPAAAGDEEDAAAGDGPSGGTGGLPG